jgi:YD repeat-containing protein
MSKEIDFSAVNEETLTALDACEEGKKWFLRNIGSLDVCLIEKIEGDYDEYIEWLSYNYTDENIQRVLQRIDPEYADGSYLSHTSEDCCVKTYDENGNVLTYSNSFDGNSWTKTYDENGNALTHKDYRGYSWSKTYDENGNALTRKDSENYSWSKTYDENRNQLTYEDSEGFSLVNTYDENGNLLTYKDSAGFTEHMTYDEYGNRLTFMRSSNGLPISSQNREFIKTDCCFIQKFNGEIEVKIYLK